MTSYPTRFPTISFLLLEIISIRVSLPLGEKDLSKGRILKYLPNRHYRALGIILVVSWLGDIKYSCGRRSSASYTRRDKMNQPMKMEKHKLLSANEKHWQLPSTVKDQHKKNRYIFTCCDIYMKYEDNMILYKSLNRELSSTFPGWGTLGEGRDSSTFGHWFQP